jgi:hypothetical protein
MKPTNRTPGLQTIPRDEKTVTATRVQFCRYVMGHHVCLLLLLYISCLCRDRLTCVAFTPGTYFSKLQSSGCRQLSIRRHCLLVDMQTSRGASSGNQNEKDHGNWLERAHQLRREAQDLESQLRPSGEAVQRPPIRTKSVQYTTLAASYWTFTYRFTSVPLSADDDSGPPPDSFGGKMTLHFRSDGFTELISHEGLSGKPLEIIKAWGWDLETSSEDEEEYLLFSVDTVLPSPGLEQRFYFQARQDLNNDGTIKLTEGTVTMKQDVASASSNGFWGFMSPKGILAEFRYVGNFVAKPSPNSSS